MMRLLLTLVVTSGILVQTGCEKSVNIATGTMAVPDKPADKAVSPTLPPPPPPGR